MKKILILASKRSDKKEKFSNYLKEYFGKKVEVHLGIFSEVTFYISQSAINVYINGLDIKEYCLVYFRNTTKFQGMAAALSIYLDYCGIKFIDRAFLNGSFTGDKFTSLIRLAVNGLPIPPSFFCWGGSVKKEKAKIATMFNFPVVAKELTTQRMESVYLLKSLADFDKLPLKNTKGAVAKYLFQKFVPIDKEFRILVLGDTIGIVHTKTVRDNTGFMIGYSNMKEYPEFLSIDSISDVIKNTALLAAKTLDIQIAGVDICREAGTGKIFLFEVNRGPGIDYDTEVSPEMEEVSKYLKNELSD